MLKSGSRTKLLKEYTDAYELIKETEKDLERLRRQQDRVHDVVKGSMEEFPYTQKNIHIEGIDRNSISSKMQRKEELLLIERKRNAQMIKEQVEEMINQMPARIQRIVKMRYFENYSWEEIAVRMGRNASADSVRMECRRYLE